jgi:hypothetical protein
MRLRWLLIICIAIGSYQYLTGRSISHLPGELVAQEPVQAKSITRPFEHKGYRITPQANFALQARVLSREIYRFDRGADLSPVDLVLGWGPMSDQRVIDEIRITQSRRFYFWRVDRFPIPRRDIERHSANMHFIPANDEVARKLKMARTGSIVQVQGQLVNVDGNDGWYWRSSLTRDDTGPGACEIIWVTSFELAHGT